MTCKFEEIMFHGEFFRGNFPESPRMVFFLRNTDEEVILEVVYVF